MFAMAVLIGAACFASLAFVSAPRSAPHSHDAAAAAAAISAATMGTPAHAEGFLNFGKVELGGGFAINLDIPETGIVNIAVLIAGLVYLLGPLLSESMSTRNQEIQQDIDDAIAKFEEATARLAEAEKSKAQADEVIAEINASVKKDQQEFEATIKAQSKAKMERASVAGDSLLKTLESQAGERVQTFINEESVKRGLDELKNLSDAQKSKFMDAAIA